MFLETHNCNTQLNSVLSFHKVEIQIKKTNLNKSTGCDNIPFDVLKEKNIMLLLYKLFNFSFENCKVPSEWMKAVICPIPKGSDTNRYLPLSYRGISL